LGTLSERSEIVEKIWHPGSYLLFPLSGAAFMLSAMPADFQNAVKWLPMVHCTEYIREGYFGSKVTSIYDLQYVVIFNVVLTLLGLSQLKIVANRVTPG